MTNKNDLISREAAIGCLGNSPEQMCMPWSEVERMLRELPAVDAVPVVRCKDCKHRPIDRREESVVYYAEMKGVGLEFPDDHCPCQCGDRWYSWYPSDDWFCASGERRDDDANLS